jgi:Leucine-rich repeat (LRR) protein
MGKFFIGNKSAELPDGCKLKNNTIECDIEDKDNFIKSNCKDRTEDIGTNEFKDVVEYQDVLVMKMGEFHYCFSKEEVEWMIKNNRSIIHNGPIDDDTMSIFQNFFGVIKQEKINLSGRNLSRLDKSLFTEDVSIIDISKNNLKNFVIDVFPMNLKKLNASNNKLENFSNLSPNIEFLDLSDNKIKRFDYLPAKLTLLDISNNMLFDNKARVSFPKTLKDLNMSGNRIYNIHLFQFPKELESLEINDNEIESIDSHLFDDPSKLKLLNIDGNKLKNINLSNFKNLEDLYISNNRLTEIPRSILELSNLKSFYFGGNDIKTISDDIYNFLKISEVEVDGDLEELRI